MDLTKTGRFKRIVTGKTVAHKRLSNPGMMLKRHSGLTDRVRVRAREMQVPTGSVSGAAKAMAAKLPIARIALAFGLIAFASLGILIGVNAYAKSREINIRLENGIAPQIITTTARTVGEFLEQNDIHLGDKDEVTPALHTRLTDGMGVMISRAMIIYITNKGQTSPLYMTGGSVADALSNANISYDQDDEITPSLDTKLTSGLRIQHVAVESVMVTEYQYVNYSTIYQKTDALLKGKTQVQQGGKEGIQTKQIQIMYKDGVEVSRKEFSNMVTREPTNRVVLKGTGTPVKTVKTSSSGKSDNSGTGKSGNTGNSSGDGGNTGSSDGGNTDSGNTDGSNSGHYADVKPEDLVVPSVPTQFSSIIYMQITAYTHTGHKAAQGGWPQYTRTLAKPGTIAVDPNAIPYGTLLYVTGYGYCVAEDTGSNTADSSRMGDVFMNTKAECYRWGRKRNVTVYIVQTDYKRSN